jgi:methionyl-tRNA formyltransferase
LDWNQDAVQLERSVRGYYPFPTASAIFAETPIKISRASIGANRAAAAGTVIEVNKEHILVACGTGTLALEVLQKPGGKALPAAQFVQSFPVKVGDRFSAN